MKLRGEKEQGKEANIKKKKKWKETKKGLDKKKNEKVAKEKWKGLLITWSFAKVLVHLVNLALHYHSTQSYFYQLSCI